jgi:hypothetical protein
MSEESLRILVPFFGVVLVAYITYFFTKSHYEKKRQDDLADRDFNRRAAIRDGRIQEAREYVDKWNNLIFIVNEINSKALQATSLNDIRQVLDVEAYNHFYLILEEVTKQVSILHILDDEELLDWHKKFLPSLLPLIRYLFETLKGIVQNNNFDIDKNKLMTLSRLCTNSVVAFARMNYRLDELAQTLK